MSGREWWLAVMNNRRIIGFVSEKGALRFKANSEIIRVIEYSAYQKLLTDLYNVTEGWATEHTLKSLELTMEQQRADRAESALTELKNEVQKIVAEDVISEQKTERLTKALNDIVATHVRSPSRMPIVIAYNALKDYEEK